MTLSLDRTESTGTDLDKLRSHAYRAPSSDDVITALRAGTTLHVDHLWDEVCAEVAVAPAQSRMTLAELDLIIGALVLRGGTVGLVGRAMAVRVAVYRAVSFRGSDAPAPRFDWARVAMDKLLRERIPRPARLVELIDLDPFAAELRTELNQAASRVAQRLGTPLGQVSIVLEGAQCTVGMSGGADSWLVEAGGVPIEWSFCATSVRTREPYVVPDTREDVLHRLNPTVLNDGVGSYAGAPLVTSTGEVLGSCCVIDLRPRDFTAADVAVLVEEAAVVVAELERRRDLRLERATHAG
jgi:hypothetical protein